MARYSIENEAILCDKEQIGSFDSGTGVITLSRSIPESAETRIKALVFDVVVAELRRKSEAGIPHEGLPPTVERPEPIENNGPPTMPGSAVPPAPECLPHLGDMTPAYMEWVAMWFPATFETQYRGRIPKKPLNLTPGDVPEGNFRPDPAEEWR